MTDRLTELSMELGDGHGFEELAAQSHALYGSAALADLPELSLAGDVLERATELAASRARKDPDGAQLLVRTTIAALAPARQMIEAAQAGDRSGQRSLLRELLAAFPEELRSQLGRRVDQELTQETPREAGRVETRSSDESEQAMGEEDERGDTPGAAHVESQSPAKPQHGAGEDDEFTESLIGVFRGELVELLSGVPDAIAGLIDPDEQMNLCADLGRIFHTVKGSAGTIGLGEIQELARIVQLAFEQAAEDPALLPLHPTLIDEIRRPLCDLFVAAGLEAPVESLDRLRSAISEVGPEPSDLEASVPAPLPPIAAQDWDAEASPAVEPEIMEAFQLAADAALEASEAALLALERDPNDRGSLRTLFRQFHTLKGAAAAVGLDRIAQQLHAGEAVLERALEETPGGATEALVQLLLELLDSIHGLLKELQGIPH
jgi:chemotaxis protein histidine kinase CheA